MNEIINQFAITRENIEKILQLYSEGDDWNDECFCQGNCLPSIDGKMSFCPSITSKEPASENANQEALIPRTFDDNRCRAFSQLYEALEDYSAKCPKLSIHHTDEALSPLSPECPLDLRENKGKTADRKDNTDGHASQETQIEDDLPTAQTIDLITKPLFSLSFPRVQESSSLEESSTGGSEDYSRISTCIFISSEDMNRAMTTQSEKMANVTVHQPFHHALQHFLSQ